MEHYVAHKPCFGLPKPRSPKLTEEQRLAQQQFAQSIPIIEREPKSHSANTRDYKRG